MIYLIGAIFAAAFAALRPGTQIIRRETPPPRSAPTDTAVAFVVGTTDRGDTIPTLIAGMSDFERIFGLRQSYSMLYDWLDTFFREGGGQAYVSRVIGPGALAATKNLLDGAAGVSLVATVRGVGTWANTYKIGVRAGGTGGTFQIFITDPTNVELETSPDLADQASAVAWSQFSSYVRITLGASSLVPAVAAAAVFAGGADDRTNITDTQWLNALNAFSTELGPGQVAAPGGTSDTRHAQLLAHAAAQNRVALIDLPDSPTSATLLSSAAAARVGNQRYGAAFAPWIVVPGVIPNTTRVVPPSALVAAKIAQVDPVQGPNQPAAGIYGQAQYASGLSQPIIDDQTRDTLLRGSVNTIRLMYGGVRVYGYRSLVDPNADPNWVSFANIRLYMSIVALADVIAENYVERQIDGAGLTMSAFQGDLTGLLLGFWAEGAIYGATPQEAFIVDTGPAVNTPLTLAARELHARLAIRMSPDAELVVIEIAKVAPNQVV